MSSRKKQGCIWRKWNKTKDFLFLLPSLAGVSLFVLIPFCDVLRRSFTSALGGQFAGFQNYRAVFSNQAFRLAAKNTLLFMGVSVPFLMVLSLGLALALYALPEASRFFRTTFLLPMAVPVASIALLWQVLFHKSGLINGWLHGIGISTIDWMGSKASFWVLVATFLWKNLGYDIVLWLAGLAGVPISIQEAARVDGAGPFKIFWHVTLPNLLPTFYTVSVLSLLGAQKVFREAYLAAGEYPHESIYLLQHLFNHWFQELSIDKLSAAAVTMAFGILAVVIGLRKIVGGSE